jgi:hypothetical protein
MSLLLKGHISSPSRTYIALCYDVGFTRIHSYKFTLPPGQSNNLSTACTYFRNRKQGKIVEGVVVAEHYEDVREEML